MPVLIIECLPVVAVDSVPVHHGGLIGQVAECTGYKVLCHQEKLEQAFPMVKHRTGVFLVRPDVYAAWQNNNLGVNIPRLHDYGSCNPCPPTTQHRGVFHQIKLDDTPALSEAQVHHLHRYSSIEMPLSKPRTVLREVGSWYGSGILLPNPPTTEVVCDDTGKPHLLHPRVFARCLGFPDVFILPRPLDCSYRLLRGCVPPLFWFPWITTACAVLGKPLAHLQDKAHEIIAGCIPEGYLSPATHQLIKRIPMPLVPNQSITVISTNWHQPFNG